MKKEAIITIIIIILILAGEWITQNYTNKKLSICLIINILQEEGMTYE